MPLKTVKTLPPAGWVFRQQTKSGTVKKMEFMGPFDDAVKEIVDYRKGNGIEPHDADSVAIELENQTCERLGNDPRWCVVQKKTSLLDKLNVLPAHVRVAAERAADVARGVRILADWLGEGAEPVPVAIAQARANVCLKCPKNVESHGVMQLTDSIAAAILEQRRKKSELDLKVEGETDLHTCQLCSCHMPLKVWVWDPLESTCRHASLSIL